MEVLNRIADHSLTGSIGILLPLTGVAFLLTGAVGGYMTRADAPRRQAGNARFRTAGMALIAEAVLFFAFWGEVGKARSQDQPPSSIWLISIALLGVIGLPVFVFALWRRTPSAPNPATN